MMTRSKSKSAAATGAVPPQLINVDKSEAPPAGATEGEQDEEDDNEAMEAAYEEARRPTAVRVYKQFIADLQAAGATEVVLTNHPSYDLNCGVCDGDIPRDQLPELGDVGDGSCTADLWNTHAFFHSVWIEAGGPSSGVRAILFENGLGNMTDLATGQPPPEGSMKTPGYS